MNSKKCSAVGGLAVTGLVQQERTQTGYPAGTLRCTKSIAVPKIGWHQGLLPTIVLMHNLGLYDTEGLQQQQQLECGPMPNVMVALPNIGGALCSMMQSLADAHY